MSDLSIRSIQPADEGQWRGLYSQYRTFYALAESVDVLDTVWSWLHDTARSTSGLVAVVDDELLGLAHIRHFDRPSTATTGLYLDDLFTRPSSRGKGVGRALLREISRIADADGLSVTRWITAADNRAARALYDSEAAATTWVTYDMTPTST